MKNLAQSPVVRPYALTGGRTRPQHDFAIEALVMTKTDSTQYLHIIRPEWQKLAELCAVVRSLAEIAAHLSIPLGVARIIVGDMLEQHLVDVHQPVDLEAPPELDVLERVLSGLQRL